MEIQNHKEEVPFSYYAAQFQTVDPQEVCRRTGAEFRNGAFHVTLLGTEYTIGWPEYTITAADGAFALNNLPCQTFLLRFLLNGKKAAASNLYQTFREMPWGELYIGPYTGRCLKRAAFTFGGRLPAFRTTCEAMGAMAVAHGDAGYQFDFIGGYRMQLMIYAGDEEFPPSSQILYTDNFADGFSAEDRVVAGDILISAIRQQMERSKR